MKILSFCFLLSIPALLSGCFSAMSGVGDAWSGGSGSSSPPAEAVVLDVITFPVQAPFLAGEGMRRINKRHAEQRLARLTERLIQDEAFRSEFIHTSPLPREKLGVFQSEELLDALSAEDIRVLWSRTDNIFSSQFACEKECEVCSWNFK